jgi:hypothetical protein
MYNLAADLSVFKPLSNREILILQKVAEVGPLRPSPSSLAHPFKRAKISSAKRAQSWRAIIAVMRSRVDSDWESCIRTGMSFPSLCGKYGGGKKKGHPEKSGLFLVARPNSLSL